MIIKNNKPKGQYLRYKLNGKILKYFFPAYATINMPDITDQSQILSNTFERRLRNIEDKFGYDLKTAFEEPSDPDYPGFTIVSSTSTFGTISPFGNIKVPESTNKTFSMIPNTITFGTSATTLTSGGTITPSGSSVSSGAYYYLSALNVDGNANQLSAVTGNVSATTTYTFTNVLTSHTIASTFALHSGSTAFTMAANANYYLNALTLNGSNIVTAITGTVSGSSTYTLSNIGKANTINASFLPYGS